MILLLLACRQPVPTVAVDPGPGSGWDHPVAVALRRGLDGYITREGRQQVFEGCEQVLDEIGTCLGNNTATPYATIFFEEDGYDAAFGSLQLDPDEAVVFVGHTPPESRYYSLQAAVHERLYLDGWETPVGSISESLNFLSMKHGGAPFDPFEQLTVVVLTGSPRTAQGLRLALEPLLEPHVDTDIVNVVELPMLGAEALDATRADPAYARDTVIDLRSGYGADSDRFSFAWRVAGADPEVAFFDADRLEGAVFKLTPEHRGDTSSWAYPHLPPLRDASNGPAPAVAESLLALTEAVRQEALVAGLEATTAPFQEPDFDGFRCVELGVRCGNSDDAWYASSAPVALPLELENAGMTAVGAVHPYILDGPPLAYSNIDVLDSHDRAGVRGWLDDGLLGSARARFPDGVPGVLDAHLDAFFILELARVCSRPGCVEIDGETIPTGHDINFLERAYLDLSTGTGPHRASVLQAQLVVWGPQVEYLSSERRFEVR